MTEKELKKIHGDDVELAPDNSEDEKLTEADAIKQAKKEGLEFVDDFAIDGPDEDSESDDLEIKTQHFDNLDDAKAYAKKHKLDPLEIVQTRSQA